LEVNAEMADIVQVVVESILVRLDERIRRIEKDEDRGDNESDFDVEIYVSNLTRGYLYRG
jgi:hypothetical protein